MKIQTSNKFGSTVESLVYPFLLIVLLWTVQWADHLLNLPLYRWGVQPGSFSGLKGIIFAPLIHSERDLFHLINNSLPIAILLGATIYFYREVAAKVFIWSWIGAGIGTWLIGESNGPFHIGISGIIYALAAFLFVSGTIRKYLPLQGISLFVAFAYGSMIWGIFPLQHHVSWEGHLSGMITGIVLAIIFRKKGPQRPKFQYEIEKELGIEPPDLEGEYWEKVRRATEMEEQRLKEMEALRTLQIFYEYKRTNGNPENNDLDQKKDN